MAGKVGLLGGTFDPIHFGHLRAAEEAYEALGLRRVIFLPTGTPPHKHRPDLTPFALRLEMVRLATAGVPHFEVSDLEERLEKPSYTVRTLSHLRRELKEELFFILGLDAFLELETWHRFRELPTLSHLVVVTRGEGGKRAFEEKLKELFPEARAQGEAWWLPGGYSLRYLPMLRLDISSTLLREAVRRGRSIRFLTPQPVADLIAARGLYRAGGVSGARVGCGRSPG